VNKGLEAEVLSPFATARDAAEADSLTRRDIAYAATLSQTVDT
jgi:hypothetical protein